MQPADAGATGRIAAAWYASHFTINVDLTDEKTHKVSLYALDDDKQNRVERIDVINPVTGVVLDTRTISNFSNGLYLSWNIQGNVQFKITSLSGPNAVISGLFFDPSS